MLVKFIEHRSLFPINNINNQLTLVKMLQNENRQSSKAFVSQVQIPVNLHQLQYRQTPYKVKENQYKIVFETELQYVREGMLCVLTFIT